MKTGRILFFILIFVGLAAVMAFPIGPAQAQEPTPSATPTVPPPAPGVIRFHVHENSQNIVIPEDAEDKIDIEGVWHGAFNDNGGIFALVQNVCQGAGCSSRDIYYKIQITVSWTSYYAQWNPTWKVAPQPHYWYGGNPHLREVNYGYCGGPTGVAGTCIISEEGMIPAAEISTSQDVIHEVFDLYLPADYGGNTNTVTYKITFSTSPISTGVSDCGGQFLLGAQLGQFELSATNSTGANLQQILGANYPAPGAWFAIRVVTGSWKNDGIGMDLQSLAYKLGESPPTWYPLATNPAIGCASGNIYYLQMVNATGSAMLRVYDTYGNWAANTGSLIIGIYGVSAHTRYQSGCELQYQIGDFIEQSTVEASRATGWPIGPTEAHPWSPLGGETLPKRYYMLETSGGPANLGSGGFTWDADLGERGGPTQLIPDTWYEIGTAPFVECIVSTDIAGHVKVFFTMDEQVTAYEFLTHYYSFRVHDADLNYADNSGTLTYKLYEATNMQVTPPGEVPGVNGCAAYSHAEIPVDSVVTLGNDLGGTSLPGDLISGDIYAFEVVDGPWADNGTNKYTVQLSDDDGDTWFDLKDYPNLLCAASSDGNHVIIYVYHAAGKVWRFRADDGDGNFTNNTLSIGMDVFEGESGLMPFPKCYEDYIVKIIPMGDAERTVPGNSAAGVPLKLIISGGEYAIAISGDQKWYDGAPSDGSYLVDISDDGGTTWTNLEYYGDCAIQIGTGDRFRVYFVAISGTYKLRVRDADGNFLNNNGYVLFDLYLANNTNPNPPPGTNPPGTTPPPEWVVACDEAYARPNGWITWYPLATFTIINPITISIPLPRVGEWLDYLRAAITYYFAWCQEHTEALKSIGQVYSTKEPIASIQDMMDFVKGIQTLLAGYQSAGGAGLPTGLTSQEPDLFSDTQYIGAAGGESHYATGASSGGPWDLFMVGNLDPATSIWFGGKLDLAASIGSTDLSVTDNYQELCSAKFYPLFGIGADPYCSLMSMMRFSKIVTWLLLAIDLFVSFWFLLKYFPNYLRRFWNILSRNKQLVGKVINNL